VCCMLLDDLEVDALTVMLFWSGELLVSLCLLHVVLVFYESNLVQPVVIGGLAHIASLVPSRVQFVS
jgi:hypothetical protein